MEFEFSESQKQLKEEARKFLAAKASIPVVRKVLDGEDSFDRGLWRDLAEMGFLGTAIPEEYGGAGAGYLELCAIAEEMGRALAPVPFSSSIYLAATAILRYGSDAQKTMLLPRLASGELIACVALSDDVGQPTRERASTLAGPHGLNGVKLPVMDGDIADLAIILATDYDADGEGASLFIANLHDEGVNRRALETIDPTRSQARIAFKDVPCERLGAIGQGPVILDQLLDHAAVLIAFEQVGGAERALEVARNYALERMAFGRAIGSFQAIKHKLVDMYISVILARANAYFGAWAISSDASQTAVAAASARVSASYAFRYCSTEACHIFGAMGFTWETDCHLYFRRARLLALCLGGQSLWGDRLIERINRLDEHVGQPA